MVSIEGTEAKYSTPVPFAGGAAYSGTPFVFDQETRKLFEDVLAKSPMGAAKPTDNAALDKARAKARSDVLMKISGLPPEEQRRIEGLLSDLESANTLGDIKKLEGDIQGEILVAVDRDRSNKAESKAEADAAAKSARMQQLWGEIGRLNQEIDKEFDKFSEWTTKEEKEQREKDKERVAAAEAALKAAKTPAEKTAALTEYKAATQTQTEHDVQQVDNADVLSGGTADTKKAKKAIADRKSETAKIVDEYSRPAPSKSSSKDSHDSKDNHAEKPTRVTLTSPGSTNAAIPNLGTASRSRMSV